MISALQRPEVVARQRAAVTKHGHASNGARTSTYRSWYSMHTRCRWRKSAGFERYGGRGITVCERWSKFENFLEDMGERPAGMTLDRIDTNGNYEPGNCRWAKLHEQYLSRSTTKLTDDMVREIRERAEHGERRLSIARRLGVGRRTVDRVIRGEAWKGVKS